MFWGNRAKLRQTNRAKVVLSQNARAMNRRIHYTGLRDVGRRRSLLPWGFKVNRFKVKDFKVKDAAKWAIPLGAFTLTSAVIAITWHRWSLDRSELGQTAQSGSGPTGSGQSKSDSGQLKSRHSIPDSWVPTSRIARTAELAMLGSRVGTSQLSARAHRIFASAERKVEIDHSLEMRTAQQVVATLGSMKGVMMKLGQMASYLDEGLPETYRSAMSQLQADAPPMSAELAAQVVESELGAAPEEIFATWDPIPIAAASIGQVHRAITHDGEPVAVKVQYPGVAQAMAADLDNTDLIARSLRLVFPALEPAGLISELRARLSEELDYLIEADNQRLFANHYKDHPFIHIPVVKDALSSQKVLTMELAEGVRLDEVEKWSQQERDLAGETIFRFVFRSLYQMKAFNGDPHPGNYLFLPGGRVTFLDFGLVKRFQPEEVSIFEEMLHTLVLEPDHEAFRAIMERIGLLSPNAPVKTSEVVNFYGRFYELVLHRGVTPLTPEFASKMARIVFDVGDPVARHTNVPQMFVVVQRINLGLYAVLARLHAKADWRRIAEELWPMVNASPSTALGEAEADWMLKRASSG